jgi:hypothetical protein
MRDLVNTAIKSFVKGEEYIDQLHDWQLLKEHCGLYVLYSWWNLRLIH